MDSPPPPTTTPSSSSPFPTSNGNGTSFLILSVSIVGILAISLLLLAYYLFLTRCHCSRGGFLFFFFFCRTGGTTAVLALDLDDDIAARPHRRSAGLEEATIRRIPTFRYRRHGHLLSDQPKPKPSSTTDECAVCLADFRDGERLRLLPPCLHAFHIDCIDAWLQSNANCPLCRAAVVVSASGAANHLLLARAATHRHQHEYIAIDIPSDAAAQQPPEEDARRPSSEPQQTDLFLPMRRSLSMDSSTDRRFYLALQRLLQQQQQQQHKHSSSGDEPDGKGESSSSSNVDGRRQRRLRRSFFSFSQISRPSPSAVMPL